MLPNGCSNSAAHPQRLAGESIGQRFQGDAAAVGLGSRAARCPDRAGRTELRNLAGQRRQLIADLLDRAKAHAAEAGLRLTPTVLSEVEATLQAALVDLAGALTIRNGRLVRPLSHSGFGPRPRNALQSRSTVEVRPVALPAEAAAEIDAPPVEDELEARRQRRAVGGRWTVELVEVTDRTSVEDNDPLQRPAACRKHFVSCD